MGERPIMRAAPSVPFAPAIETVTDGSHVPPAEVVKQLVQGGEAPANAVREVTAAIAIGAVTVPEPLAPAGPESDRRYGRLLAVFEAGRISTRAGTGRVRPVGAEDAYRLIAVWRGESEPRVRQHFFSFLTNMLSRLPEEHMASMVEATHRLRVVGERMVDGRDMTLAVLNRVAGRISIHPDEGFPQYGDARLGESRAATLETLAGRYQASRAAKRAQ